MRRLTLGIILVLGLAGCSGQGDASSTAPGAEESTALSPSAAESASSSASSGGGVGALCAEGHEPCPLEAGTYSSAPFEPAFTFTIDDDWLNDRAFADGGGISKETGGIYWASGVSGGTVAGEEVEIGASPEEFVAFLQTLEVAGMTVSEPTPASVDGVEGQQVDVAANDVEAPALYFIEEDQFNLVANEKARFIVLEKDGETLILIIDSFTAADFDEWLATAEPVMESIRWE